MARAARILDGVVNGCHMTNKMILARITSVVAFDEQMQRIIIIKNRGRLGYLFNSYL